MSMQPRGPGEVPAETVRVARAAFPKGSLAIRIRDELGVLFTDGQFAGLFPARGKPAWSPGRLALVSVLQFVEGLSDRQAAEAVRARIDFKYALGLELTDPGFDYSVLSEFRSRLVAAGAGQDIFDRVLAATREKGLLRAGGRARTDSTHVLGAIRSLNRLEFVIETLRAALNAVAAATPAWLSSHADPQWFDRYADRPEDYWLPKKPTQRTELAELTGTDGMRLLRDIFTSPGAPAWLREVPAVEVLRAAWVQQYFVDADGQVRWRDPKDCPPGARRLVTPYDTEVRASLKRDIKWDGFKVHLTETCEPGTPNLITHVLTTDATVPDIKATETVHDALADQDLLPGEHLLDAGYVDGRRLVTAQQHGITMTGPVAGDTTTQAGGSFSQDAFTVDWEKKTVTRPSGQTNVVWRDTTSHRDTPVVRARFAARHCNPCPDRENCTSSPKGRMITLRPREEHEAIRAARAAQGTPAWRARYAARNGIEGTISQAVHALSLRQCRYHGLAKTRLQHQLTATALNLTRIDAWTRGKPRAHTRTSHLERLRPAEIALSGTN
ncbi:IS1182 family transposase [Streptomyces sp. NPDC057249]|uniref:IS1182 family transposase n=1 Tax=Streptomyces sp. NPDC057249 TaxID=3346067 RepID=UPI003639951F